MTGNGKHGLGESSPKQSNKRHKWTQHGSKNGVGRLPKTEARDEFAFGRPPNPYRMNATKIAIKPPPQKSKGASAPVAAASPQSSTKSQKHTQEIIEIDSSDNEEHESTLEMAGFMQNVENEIEKGNPMDQVEVNATLDSFLGKKISSPSKQKIAFQASTTSSLAPQGHTQDGNRNAAAGFASCQMSQAATLRLLMDSKPAAVEHATPTKPVANNTNTGKLDDLNDIQENTDDIQGHCTGAKDNTNSSNLSPQEATRDGNRNAAASFASRQMSPSVTPKAAPAAGEYATLPKPAANSTNTGTLDDLNGIQQETDGIQGLHTGADDNTDRNDSPTKDSDVVHDFSEKEGLTNNETAASENATDNIQDGSKEQKQQKPVTAAASASTVW
eukprot:CAMPEP_0202491492 /NCGR_PEP_ID=MMETSP1361-20130828/8538_1 /ASSEMBLY_ACC=CAM_ASM_000849 /TAXON_ID=210615 /ORGANISM="Staurosira complex sp., Strain CCMP2646" /LENGTH=386 /DNA_ID=CAMNT_0049121549 /DNA_START=125 /DNA_END=1282 /DNA_ORIENTATION=-